MSIKIQHDRLDLCKVQIKAERDNKFTILVNSNKTMDGNGVLRKSKSPKGSYFIIYGNVGERVEDSPFVEIQTPSGRVPRLSVVTQRYMKLCKDLDKLKFTRI